MRRSAIVFFLLLFTFAPIRVHAFPTGVRLCRRRAKRFVLAKTRWPTTDLTWQFRDPFGMFKKEEQRETARHLANKVHNVSAQR
ncbi:hypothetical protein L596_017218 [Steinernema carpocapsae]|uniref:Secreted protein n=1 Tax=Steinernema carpocapsae TaxID=34508 RepID=A0A4U5N187_STECR|nr:hypothetical protein L596_017218 [Steinernema carpocapsae]